MRTNNTRHNHATRPHTPRRTRPTTHVVDLEYLTPSKPTHPKSHSSHAHCGHEVLAQPAVGRLLDKLCDDVTQADHANGATVVVDHKEPVHVSARQLANHILQLSAGIRCERWCEMHANQILSCACVQLQPLNVKVRIAHLQHKIMREQLDRARANRLAHGSELNGVQYHLAYVVRADDAGQLALSRQYSHSTHVLHTVKQM